MGQHGWLSVAAVEPVLRIHLEEHVATATVEQVTAAFVTLAALLDLR